MARYTRQQLKKDDRFVEAAEDAVHWTVIHRNTLVYAGAAVLVALLVAIGGYAYLQHQEQGASLGLGKALRIYRAPLSSPEAPAMPGTASYTTVAERAKAAQKEFQAILDEYPYTRNADAARYFLGLAAMDAGDTAAAEKHLGEVTKIRNEDLAALAKFALGSLYRKTGRDSMAIDQYKALAEKPTASVPKVTAQLELAATYEKMLPDEARRIYEQIRREAPASSAAQFAATRLGMGDER